MNKLLKQINKTTQKKKIKFKFKCSECGKIYYRVRRPKTEKWLYCIYCQECTLEEIE